jgi:hypothetical protein
MKTASPMLLCSLIVLATCPSGRSQEPGRVPASAITGCTQGAACGFPGCGLNCFQWTLGCFPRCGCPDDYCPNPYPKQCWPPYPPFYRCVPAGDCARSCGGGEGKDRLTWWFIPTPRALRAALWCEP